MLNVLPRLTGFLVARHVEISYSASLDLWILRDQRAPRVVRDLNDMREALERIREVVENYQSPRRSWWAVVPADQYRFTQFI